MERKRPPLNGNLIILPQSINTPGTEIAPGSDIIGEYFQKNRLSHGFLLLSNIYFHSVLRQEDFTGKFFLAFLDNIVPLKNRIKVSEQKFFTRSFPGDPACDRRGEMACGFSFIGERTFQDQEVSTLSQPDDVLAVIRIAGINERFPPGLHTESNTRIRVEHGECFYIKTRKLHTALLDLVEENRVGLGINPMAKNRPELLREGFKTVRTDYPKGKRAREIDRVIHGKKERDEIGNVVRVKMGEAEEIDLAIIQAQPDHLPQRTAPAVKKN
jgi:hypothetical protein